ncbi:lipid-binding SYLF domain-containing protein [Prochlorococcus marinus XMU1419]|uniref:lipid-binding SYLF domain-containing protein n=1 Tax=Prochlorococcus marinus TaxID=1219 RepID=UPI001ADBF4C0|nr:lipid-binding SYLF domain-containing protein [Prochlorococcus marinus]MBO8234150.1 lipid-binding SYLF domain-containing protein [Prochlorococcus marinus XMU1419]MBW3077607.1 hypothetical protein [Prochlorococcus marinus str. XMU1419]|tara:strand:+ start:2898 stop:3497 length:600 start_codon:yes stop_codon:yes gene_type:complete
MKILNKFVIILFTSIFCFSYQPINANSKSYLSNKSELLIGWETQKNSNLEKRANFKTIDVLKKLKKIQRLKIYFKEAVGYVVFPNVGKLGIGIGGARGNGEVFEDHKVIGSATVTQLSVGFQLGAQAFSQIIFFQNKKDLDRFTEGNFEFDASASAALITEGANASADYSNGAAVFTFSKGGLMYEASIGGQKFSYQGY